VAGSISQVDRLAVYKALGDDTRYALYAELMSSSAPLSTSELAERLDLHPNTVRPHLERLREVGLLEVDSDSRGSVGRPQHRYRPTSAGPTTGAQAADYHLLAGLLADLAGDRGVSPGKAAAVGRREGRRLAAAGPNRDPGPAPEAFRSRRAAAARTAGVEARAPTPPRTACVAALRDLMERMGFEPEVAESEHTASMIFSRCPFRDVAEAHPDLVCHLHRGILEGAAELVGGAEISEFATLADARPCRAELAVR
jgi:predicted ArsR family transcriptional regulator